MDAARAAVPRALQEIPPAGFELKEAVKTLDASNNRLTALPPALAGLTSLQRLVRRGGARPARPWRALNARARSLLPRAPRRAHRPGAARAPRGRCRSADAAGALWRASQVLAQNALTALPPALPSLAALRLLLLDGNALTALPADIGRLRKLERLSVAGNALTELPPSLGELRSLKALVVSRNRLASLPAALAGCAALEELDASGNALRAVPPELGALTSLAALRLDDNALSGVPEALLAGCSALTTLSLHGNPVTLEALQATPGWAAFDARQRGKQSKRVAGGVMLGARGLDDGLDHATTRIVVPHT
jgi:hypothetical protein